LSEESEDSEKEELKGSFLYRNSVSPPKKKKKQERTKKEEKCVTIQAKIISLLEIHVF